MILFKLCLVTMLGCSLQAQVYTPQNNRHILWKILENRIRVDGLRLLQRQTQFDYGHSLYEPMLPEVRILPTSRFGGRLSTLNRPSDMLIDNRFLTIDDALKIRVSLHDILRITSDSPDQERNSGQKHEPWWKKIKVDTSTDMKLSTDMVRSYKLRFRYLFGPSELYLGFNYFPVRDNEVVAGFSLTF